MKKVSILNLAALAVLLSAGCGSKEKATATNFELIPLDNPAATVSLANFEGKVVVLDFWATWCGPCKQTMPIVNALNDAYHGLGVEVVGVTDEDREKVFQFEQSNKFKYPKYLDPIGKVAKDYGVTELPQVIVIGADRKIYWRGHPADSEKLRVAVEDALSARDAKKA